MEKESKKEIVNTTISYTYEIMMNDLRRLKEKYPFLQLGNIGYTVLGKPIPYVKIGTGEKEVLYSASFHANEWITTVVLMKFIEDFCNSYENDKKLFNRNVREIFDKTSMYIVPMINPDGVNLVTGAIPVESSIYKDFKKIASNYPEIPFPDGWKANFNGVDLENLQPFSQSLVIVDIAQFCISYFLDELILSTLSNPSFE